MTQTSRLRAVAESVAAELNAGTWAESFTAVEKRLPDVSLESLTTALSVTCVGTGETRVRVSRGMSAIQIKVGIEIRRKIDPEADSDALEYLGEQFVDYFVPDGGSRFLGTYPSARVDAAEFVPFDWEMLLTNHALLGLVTLTLTIDT